MGPESEDRLETQTWSAAAAAAPGPPVVPGLTILSHPEAQRVGERVALLELSSGREARLSRAEPGFSAPGGASFRPLAVPYLSRRPWRLQPAVDGGVQLLRGDSPMPLVANGEPVATAGTFSADEVGRGVVLLLAHQVVLLLHRFRPVFPGHPTRYGMVGESDRLLDVCRQIAQIGDLDLPVLLRGESGTGKELVAAALHRASRRRERPYLTLNLGALPPSLAAAELFGAARGAFTGAEQSRRGYFRRAHGGTLFLDEIGEAPQEVQPMLLRALESGEIQALGSEEPVRVDVRILAATDADLDQAVAAGSFRAPLLHRLGGYTLRLPALCERRDDIGRLFFHFLRHELEALGEERRLAAPAPDTPSWPPAAWVARLAAAAWPGNVRQLRNAARGIAVESRGAALPQLTPALEALFRAAESRVEAKAPEAGPGAPRPAPPRAAYRSPQEVSEAELLAALGAHRWQPGETARALGISRPSLYALLDAFPGTRKAMDLSREEIVKAGERCGGRLGEMAEVLKVSESGIKRRMKELGLLALGKGPP